MAISMLGYDILGELIDQKAVIIMSAKTVVEISAFPNVSSYSQATIYKQVETLYNLGYLKVGVKKGNAYTYYISESGIQHFYDAVGAGAAPSVKSILEDK